MASSGQANVIKKADFFGGVCFSVVGFYHCYNKANLLAISPYSTVLGRFLRLV